jgi:hypothetical protein
MEMNFIISVLAGSPTFATSGIVVPVLPEK